VKVKRQSAICKKKTGRPENLQLPDEALTFLPDMAGTAANGRIFPLSTGEYANATLKARIPAAGITGRVTFRVSGHTDAALPLSPGVPVETAGKLLGQTYRLHGYTPKR
jgi:hypothetical protein